ncbi:hypothetical protein [Stenotrophomonas rhizophila]|uniref:hypothetical protein n=1 Tax=Stenotrophomonas rhizophila TaxID=216778 RepID=UPI001E3AF581|nr:hypothetical protein [Stenotrophomonas rhizophila]MCC7634198.1 hypothetical protein [Stenotrophomonas rhizophila]MCC7662894.1 hypothetical protein [Stenotrophomonas rhizophila]
MNNNVVVQLKVEAGLRASFQQAAGRQQRPPAQVIRQLMREYVARQSAPAVAAGRQPLEAARAVAAPLVADEPLAASQPPDPPPCYASGDRDLEQMAQRQYGWHSSPFGAE